MPRGSTPPYPFLKWAGGKGQLLEQLSPLLPPKETVSRYVEPFVGGGAVFFHVQRLLAPKAIVLCDSNAELIGAYRAIRDDVDGLIEQLRVHKAKHGEKYYYRMRATDPSKLSQVERAARVIYLNKTCFNGLYRVNSRGLFNVPIGRYKNPLILDEPNLRAVSDALRDVDIKPAGDFRGVATWAKAGDFVYFDPPYQPISKTASFTSYTDRVFGEAEQRSLLELYVELARKGCRLMLSNSDAGLVQELYEGFRVETVLARRSINSKGAKRGRIREVVVLNYQPSGELLEERAWPAGRSRSRAATS